MSDTLDRVPPYLPIVWQDWDSSIEIQNMSLAEEGIYFRLIRKLWVLDELSGTPRRLAQLIRVPDYRTMLRWLDKYGHLMQVDKKHTRECTVSLQEVYRNLTVDVRETTCECPVKIRSEKLQKLKNNVKTGGRDFGTKPNLNQTQTEPSLLASQSASQLTTTDVVSKEKRRPKELGLLVLRDEEAPVYALSCYDVLHAEFGSDMQIPETTVREIHSALKQLGHDEDWLRGCLRYAFGHKKFWANRIVNVQNLADALIRGLDDPEAKRLPTQYNRHLAGKKRGAAVGGK